MGNVTFGRRPADAVTDEERQVVGDIDRALSQLNAVLLQASNLGLKIDINTYEMVQIGRFPTVRYSRSRVMKQHEIKPL